MTYLFFFFITSAVPNPKKIKKITQKNSYKANYLLATSLPTTYNIV